MAWASLPGRVLGNSTECRARARRAPMTFHDYHGGDMVTPRHPTGLRLGAGETRVEGTEPFKDEPRVLKREGLPRTSPARVGWGQQRQASTSH